MANYETWDLKNILINATVDGVTFGCSRKEVEERFGIANAYDCGLRSRGITVFVKFHQSLVKLIT